MKNKYQSPNWVNKILKPNHITSVALLKVSIWCLFIGLNLTFCCSLYAQTAVSNLWSDTFGLQDTVVKTPMVIGPNNEVFVAGTETTQSGGVDILIKRIDSTGQTIWSENFSGSGFYRDQPSSIVLDGAGFVYIAGTTYIPGNNYDFLVLKYDTAGTFYWSYSFNGSLGLADGAIAIGIDSSQVFVSGACMDSVGGINYCTMRISSAGILQWRNTYNYNGYADIPYDLSIFDGQVTVTGGSQSSLSNWDYATVRYNGYTGAQNNVNRVSGNGIGFDHASQVVTDNNGNIYITGSNSIVGNGLDIRTIKFDSLFNVVWNVTYDYTHSNDHGNSLTVDDFGNVYVAGYSGNGTDEDYLILKYDDSGNLIL